jgi:hypothetical protein
VSDTRIVCIGYIEDSRLEIDREEFRGKLKRLPDGPVTVTVTHIGEQSSYRQMQKYWHAVPVEVVGRELGSQHDPMHYALLGEWRGYMDGPLGERLPICCASRRLTREEWRELIDWVLLWGPSERGIVIPEPESRRANEMVAAYHAAGGET